jgi:hypothetical protein
LGLKSYVEEISVAGHESKAIAAATVAVLLSTQTVLALDISRAQKYVEEKVQAPEPKKERNKSLENCDAHLGRCATIPCPEAVKHECEEFCAAMSVGCEALRKGDDAKAAEFLQRAQEYKDQAKKLQR